MLVTVSGGGSALALLLAPLEHDAPGVRCRILLQAPHVCVFLVHISLWMGFPSSGWTFVAVQVCGCPGSAHAGLLHAPWRCPIPKTRGPLAALAPHWDQQDYGFFAQGRDA